MLITRPISRSPLPRRPFASFDDFDRITREMDRLFDAAALGRRSIPAVPGLNVWRDADSVVAEAELPGFTADEIEILATEDTLTLRGSRSSSTPEGATRVRIERTLTSFERSIRLPVEINPEGVAASLENGLLRVTLPVAEAARPRRVEVRAGGGQALPEGRTGGPESA